MTQFKNAIITASAGTGKTYRLSIEYISLILSYYEHSDFKLDSILALTFTRKATAEIRERILSQIQELLKNPACAIVQDLRKYIPGDPQKLSEKEQGILLSAYQEISADLQNLQIMTIDSYTANIFRNIVRPMKSIDEYEIDQDAVNKSLPLLMDHLMKPEFRSRIDKLLSRKVHRSMDDYAPFFKDLIYNRWLYFLISSRCSLKRDYLDLPRKDFAKAALGLGNAIQAGIKDQNSKGFADALLSEIKKLFNRPPQNPAEFSSTLQSLLKDPTDAMILFRSFKKDFISKRVVQKEHQEHCALLYQEALSALAEEIYHRYYLPEEREILDVWGIVLEEYDRLLYRYKKLNYQDIAWITFQALFSNDPPEFKFNDENSANEFYMFLSHRTRFMLIDEFQDTSLIQFNMLRPIMEEISSGYGSKDFGGLIVVGDEKQSIFGWRGGERDLLLNLNRIIPSLHELKTEVLNKSWRSGKDMVDFINAVFGDEALHLAINQEGMNWPYTPVQSALGKLDATIEIATKAFSDQKGTRPQIYSYFVDEMIMPQLKLYKDDPKKSIAILGRTSKQLSQIQLLLEERGETGVFQPSASIVEHRLVAPLIAWLRFVYFGNWQDFLAFLRSDYLLLSGAKLKQVIDQIALFEHGASPQEQSPALPETVADIYALAQTHKTQTPYAILRELTVLVMKDPSAIPQRDLLNLQAFLDICAAWEMQEAKKGTRIPDFLNYLLENQNQESMTQRSVEGVGGVQLLTIHKSKGLQFDKVFVLYNLSSGGHNEKKLFWASEFLDHEFKYIKDYSLSFHFDSILPHSPARAVWETKQKQEKLEELNNLYVAFTRAKSDLHVLFAYHSSSSWDEYLDAREDGTNLPLMLAGACTRQFSADQCVSEGLRRKSFSYTVPESPDKDMQDSTSPLVIENLPLLKLRPEALKAAAPRKALDINFKQVYLDKRQALYGDLVHYYLSFIIKDIPKEHERARRETIRRFASILEIVKIQRTIQKSCEELRKHSYLFAPEYDKVFNEFAIGSYRIDRLMLNTSAKIALLIDYKTGGIHEAEQLENYIIELQKLPALKDYSFKSQYLSLDIH